MIRWPHVKFWDLVEALSEHGKVTVVVTVLAKSKVFQLKSKVSNTPADLPYTLTGAHLFTLQRLYLVVLTKASFNVSHTIHILLFLMTHFNSSLQLKAVKSSIWWKCSISAWSLPYRSLTLFDSSRQSFQSSSLNPATIETQSVDLVQRPCDQHRAFVSELVET